MNGWHPAMEMGSPSSGTPRANTHKLRPHEDSPDKGPDREKGRTVVVAQR